MDNSCLLLLLHSWKVAREVISSNWPGHETFPMANTKPLAQCDSIGYLGLTSGGNLPVYIQFFVSCYRISLQTKQIFFSFMSEWLKSDNCSSHVCVCMQVWISIKISILFICQTDFSLLFLTTINWNDLHENYVVIKVMVNKRNIAYFCNFTPYSN